MIDGAAPADIDAMWEMFERVVAADTSPPPGDHRVASDDPRLTAFIEDVARPLLEAIGATTTFDSAGNLLASFGEPTGRELLLVAYSVVHHANAMEDPLVARRVIDERGEHWVGQGASEGKAAFVSVLTALQRCVADGVELAGRVTVAVSTEGSSTNDSSTVMFDEMAVLPAAAVLTIGTGNDIALGHRGRADILLTTTATAVHSSIAAGLANPISDICAAQQRTVAVAAQWAARSEDGRRSITPYRLVCGPIAPHTIPERCELALDCRYLPGDDPAEIGRLVEDAVDNERVTVSFGPVMLPASTDPTARVVTAFMDAAQAVDARSQTFMPPWTFDAGAASTRGIPTILFGPSSDNLHSIVGADAVSRDAIVAAADIFTHVIERWT